MSVHTFCENKKGAFSWENSQDFPLAKRTELACPSGAQEGRHLRFLPSWESPVSWPNLTQIADMWPLRNRERQRIFTSTGRLLAVYVSAYSQCQILYCYTDRLLYAERDIPVSRSSIAWWLRKAPANLSDWYNLSSQVPSDTTRSPVARHCYAAPTAF